MLVKRLETPKNNNKKNNVRLLLGSSSMKQSTLRKKKIFTLKEAYTVSHQQKEALFRKCSFEGFQLACFTADCTDCRSLFALIKRTLGGIA